jgi:hypothetical protein
MNLRIPTSSWHDVVAADPQFADQVRRTFAVRKHATLATLRRDESPRSSGTEVDFAADGNLYLGRMPCSLKALDLRRDPRLALHCPTEDNPAAWLGDGKMAGTAVGVSDPSRVDQPHRFRIDVTEVVLTASPQTVTISASSPGIPAAAGSDESVGEAM